MKGGINPGCQVARATLFCEGVPHFYGSSVWNMDYEPVARVPKMASGEFSLARGIQSLLSQFLLSDQRLYIVQNKCIYTHVTVYRLYMNYRCYQTTLQ